jgi:hypothetical protein
MPSKKGLIEFILENGSGFSKKELEALPLTSLVLIKVQIEVTIKQNKN